MLAHPRLRLPRFREFRFEPLDQEAAVRVVDSTRDHLDGRARRGKWCGVVRRLRGKDAGTGGGKRGKEGALDYGAVECGVRNCWGV